MFKGLIDSSVILQCKARTKKNCQVLYWNNIECFLEVGGFTVYVSDAFLRLSNDFLLERY